MNENLKPVEKLTPFTKMIMTIGTLPSSFNASMSYYESMVWLYEYLKNQVIPAVNNNGEAVEELQEKFIELKEWTETYTEETIPTEIENKLDEMAEDGTLTLLISKYINENAQLTFNTLDDMKNSQFLSEDSIVKTNGFHEYNDNGGALYKIRKIENNETADNMFLIALDNEELIAELIIEEMLNIKQIGAYGDGTHDDTIIIQAGINKIHDNAITNGRLTKNTLIIPAGKYLISSTIDLTTLVKIKTVGLAELYYTGNSTCLRIKGSDTSNPNDGLIAQEWFSGSQISGQGLIIYNSGSRSSTVGLELGLTTDSGQSYNNNRRYVIENIRINGFNIGILLNSVHHFGLTFQHSFIWNCDIDVNLGNLNGTSINSGEKMSFNDCIFSNSHIGFKWTAPYMDLQLYNCSVDMNDALFVDDTSTGIVRVETFGGHFENIFNRMLDEEWNTYSGFVCGHFYSGAIIMNTPRIVFTNDNRLITDTNIDWSCLIVLNNPIINSSGNIADVSQTTYQHTFTSTARITITGLQANSYHSAIENGNIDLLFIPSCDNVNLFYGNKFENVTTGALTIATSGTVGNLSLPWFSHIDTSASITEDSPLTNGKVFNVTKTETDGYIRIETPKINVTPNKMYYANSLTKNVSNVAIQFKYYDENDQLIKSYNKGHYEVIDKDENFGNWYISPYSKFTVAPNGAKSCTVMFELSTSTGFTTELVTYSIAGLFVQEA